jgi:hypothetical protein
MIAQVSLDQTSMADQQHVVLVAAVLLLGMSVGCWRALRTARNRYGEATPEQHTDEIARTLAHVANAEAARSMENV